MRAAAGVPPLRFDPVLAGGALTRARELARFDYVGHDRPDGSDFITVFESPWSRYALLGENINMIQTVATDGLAAFAVQGLMDSPPHRGTMLSNRFEAAGVGAELSLENGKWFVVIIYADVL